jgi:hypothetical protein
MPWRLAIGHGQGFGGSFDDGPVSGGPVEVGCGQGEAADAFRRPEARGEPAWLEVLLRQCDGENVYPAEVESVLADMPGVVDVAVAPGMTVPATHPPSLNQGAPPPDGRTGVAHRLLGRRDQVKTLVKASLSSRAW